MVELINFVSMASSGSMRSMNVDSFTGIEANTRHANTKSALGLWLLNVNADHSESFVSSTHRKVMETDNFCNGVDHATLFESFKDNDSFHCFLNTPWSRNVLEEDSICEYSESDEPFSSSESEGLGRPAGNQHVQYGPLDEMSTLADMIKSNTDVLARCATEKDIRPSLDVNGDSLKLALTDRDALQAKADLLHAMKRLQSLVKGPMGILMDIGVRPTQVPLEETADYLCRPTKYFACKQSLGSGSRRRYKWMKMSASMNCPKDAESMSRISNAFYATP